MHDIHDSNTEAHIFFNTVKSTNDDALMRILNILRIKF